MNKSRVRAESSVSAMVYRRKLQLKHSFKFNELSPHYLELMYLKYIELLGICWVSNCKWSFVSWFIKYMKFRYYWINKISKTQHSLQNNLKVKNVSKHNLERSVFQGRRLSTVCSAGTRFRAPALLVVAVQMVPERLVTRRTVPWNMTATSRLVIA